MNTYKGQFLVASPHLTDANFFRSVVLLIQHNEEGAFGVVLNRPLGTGAAAVLESVFEKSANDIGPIHLGGPVPGPLMALHTNENHSDLEVLPGLYMTTRKEGLMDVVALGEPVRIFSGYAGWGESQLESELQGGGWVTLPAKVQEVFSDRETLWTQVSRRIGEDLLKMKFIPDDPSMN